jgi:catechol 2,3-dioxygenase-like lactoylglutathione lyase family enzyme
MLRTATPICFVATADGAAARQFYEEVLGLTCLSDDEYGVVFELSGVVLRVQKVPRFEPQEQTVHGWRVADIESEIKELTAKGVVFERFPCFEQDELGIWEMQGVRICWFRDPSGNLLSLSEVKRGS